MLKTSGRIDTKVDTLIIGCGNLLRGDDAVGPVLIRHLWDLGIPDDVHCADGGTGGMDVAFQMRGVRHVILVDACVSGSEPGELFCLPGEATEHLPPLEGINLHAFRWDHALSFARWLLKDDYPKKVTVYLIEARDLVIGEPLSPPVESAMRDLAKRLLAELAERPETNTPCPEESMPLEVEFTADGYLHLPVELACEHFHSDGIVAVVRGPELWLMPTHNSASGGYLLKRRNLQGDRTLLIWEALRMRAITGRRIAFWDDREGALRVALEAYDA